MLLPLLLILSRVVSTFDVKRNVYKSTADKSTDITFPIICVLVNCDRKSYIATSTRTASIAAIYLSGRISSL